jgi:H+/Na+-translocating ferredoxin:NAD+ oxidoreductase subunit B
MTTETLHIALWGLAVFTVLGVFFGFALAAVAMKFQVATNPLVERVREALPSANCGACGFAGCSAYAEAVVTRADVPVNLCAPGRAEVARNLGQLTGKDIGSIVDRIVMMRCNGTTAFARQEAQYAGIETCAAAVLVFGGPKACKNGCLGLADCVRACPFAALAIGDGGIAEVDQEKCTGCGVCIPVCPKDLFQLYPRNHRVELSCVARDKAVVVRPTCAVGCITCRKCVMKCPAGAITYDGGTIVIGHEACIAYGPSCNEICVDVCPTIILHRVGQTPQPAPARAEVTQT